MPETVENGSEAQLNANHPVETGENEKITAAMKDLSGVTDSFDKAEGASDKLKFCRTCASIEE
jgi:hypothetical protein